MKKKETIDYQELIQQISEIIYNWKDKLNPHNSADKILDHILKQKSICDNNPSDTKIWTIAIVKNLKSYPIK